MHKPLISGIMAVLVMVFGAARPMAAIFEDTGNKNINLYDEWDLNRDGYIGNGEFYLHSFGSADHDADGVLDRDEWYDYTAYWYEPYGIVYEDFAYYDIDGSGYLGADEYDVIVAGNRLYSYWDRNDNGYITNDEYDLAMGIFQGYGTGAY